MPSVLFAFVFSYHVRFLLKRSVKSCGLAASLTAGANAEPPNHRFAPLVSARPLVLRESSPPALRPILFRKEETMNEQWRFVPCDEREKQILLFSSPQRRQARGVDSDGTEIGGAGRRRRAQRLTRGTRSPENAA